MSLSFPASPTLNDQYTSGGNVWYWDGIKWRTLGSVLGPVGPAGATGGSSNDLPTITAVTYTDIAFVTSANTSLLPSTTGYIKLTGTNFSSYSTVYVNNTKATTTYVSSTQLNVIMPALSAGTYNIYLYNTNNGGCTIKAAGVTYSTTKAYGGIVSTSGSYTVHGFTSSGTFTTTQSLTVDYLIVAGGGAAGNGYQMSGGGAGGLRSFTSQSLSAGTYNIVVGAGATFTSFSSSANNGSDSSAFGYTSTGGGGGASQYVVYTAGTGGSGGGGNLGSGTFGNPGSGTYVGGSGNTPSVSPVQGYSGGNVTISTNAAAGGGGAGGAGGNVTSSNVAGNGGAGTQVSTFDMYGTTSGNLATGTSGRGYFGGGGAGSYRTSGTMGTAGVGGGGSNTVAAIANTGGGGGANIYYNRASGASGIVIVRYLT